VDVTPAVEEATTGAAERAAGRAERAAWVTQARTARVGNAPARKTVCEHPSRAGAGLCADCPREVTPGTIAVPSARVISPGQDSIAAPARQVPDAAELLRRTLDGIGLFLVDHVWFTSKSQVIGAAGWIGQAAARDSDGEPLWLAFPRFLVTSRLNGSGKSTLADQARIILGCRAGRASKITPYGLCKVLGTYKEAAIADDAQNVFRSDKAGAELLSVIINGYTIGATWVSGKSDGRIENAWGPVMVVGKDDLITKRYETLKDLIDRCAPLLRMERPPRYMPQLDWDARARGAALGRALTTATSALVDELRQAEAGLARETQGALITDGDGGRIAQVWRPLEAVARVAGGHWPEAMAQAREELATAGGDLLSAAEELDRIGTDGRSFWDE